MNEPRGFTRLEAQAFEHWANGLHRAKLLTYEQYREVFEKINNRIIR